VASLRWIRRRVADLGRRFVDTFLRDNKLLPPILALLALFVFAWVLAGAFLGGTDKHRPVAHHSELAQVDGGGGSNPPAPQVENRNVNSYAAYRSKDPFREIIAEASTTPEGTPSVPTEQTTTGPGKPKGGNSSNRDSDSDGLPDSKEADLGLDPNNPDTDGDGIPDGLDDANGDGRPDGAKGGAAAGGRPGRGGGLLNSGGTLSPPP
jgi:hypothetical protein